MDDLGIFLLHLTRQVRVHQNLGKRADGGHWGAQFVADLAEEGILLHRQIAEFLIRLGQLPGGAGDLFGLGLKLGGIFEDLLRFRGHRHQVLRRHRRADGELRDHRMGRGRTDRARKAAFQLVDEIGRGFGQEIGLALRRRLGLKELLRLGGAKDALCHDQQVLRLGPAARPAARARPVIVDIDEGKTLHPLQGLREGQERDEDEGESVQRQRPENGMQKRVQPLDPEKRLRAEPAETERPPVQQRP